MKNSEGLGDQRLSALCGEPCAREAGEPILLRRGGVTPASFKEEPRFRADIADYSTSRMTPNTSASR